MYTSSALLVPFGILDIFVGGLQENTATNQTNFMRYAVGKLCCFSAQRNNSETTLPVSKIW